ncbi:hypothetical protein LTR99_007269 [Exophiala xenobiotica]|uniref:Uncharacterized protein n=1 Tax=Vermiconidia calcicola TaxID=1690605 RepID=A0AAV9Q4R8_9PEZI|nr:hypothetical protein H2202_006675 [Exophiala xenobiotica]KAK5534379.1 hypothetical protein LTR25_006411 [Vermiconidia calcicola]KAK5536174.1 hypothetical protein LTR23_008195 [Chaetothyriales sp. CCFEE 6169]KAK5198479.1 hypothetical protein LTR92_002724 [Exophiala xenobiotica]KAK5207316.1 hypothetical protein LTR41_006885 [Exophiala xenobiotica]
MAGSSTPSAQPQEAAKSMSSRLLNMKFMQRAAASSTTSTPAASTSATPTTEHLAKRRRVESQASPPSTSTPGTPYTPVEAHSPSTTFGLSRGGSSTFNRGLGADTEWVLNLETTIENSSKTRARSQANGKSSKGSRFNGLAEDSGEGTDPEEEDIWNNQPSGRQTYGSFKQKRKSRPKPNNAANDESIDSPSDQSESDGHDLSHQRTPSGKRKKNHSKGADSDEEMRQVRKAIEAKHRNMMSTGPPRANLAGGGNSPYQSFAGNQGGYGQKRRREDGDYKSRKKLRKTI